MLYKIKRVVLNLNLSIQLYIFCRPRCLNDYIQIQILEINCDVISRLSPQDKIAKLQTGTFSITYTHLSLKVIFYICPNNFCVIG